MIIVIADDLTGAAEIAGIAHRYGLHTKVTWAVDQTQPGTNVLIICSDTRSMKRDNALVHLKQILHSVKKMQPVFIFKKIDSVMRGYVLDEIVLQMNEMANDKILLVPANPSLGRTIINGNYFVDNRIITDTVFVNDPEFPVRSADVRKMLGNVNAKVMKAGDMLPGNGIVIGEVSNQVDMDAWAHLIGDWIPVGGGDFFEALIRKHRKPMVQQMSSIQFPLLYCCGTAVAGRKEWIRSIAAASGAVLWMDEDNVSIATNAARLLTEKRKLIIAIPGQEGKADQLRLQMADLVYEILTRCAVREIFIEGGSTAAAVLQRLAIRELIPVDEWQRGAVRMKGAEYYITLKPGSYVLPGELQNIFEQ